MNPKKTGRYKLGQQNRQILLDFLNGLGRWARTTECAKHTAELRGTDNLKGELQTINKRLSQMVATGEVEVRRVQGHHGEQNEWRALRKKTADACLCATRAPEPVETFVTRRRPGYVRHCGMNRDRPLQAQGGQGALRREFGIQSGMA